MTKEELEQHANLVRTIEREEERMVAIANKISVAEEQAAVETLKKTKLRQLQEDIKELRTKETEQAAAIEDVLKRMDSDSEVQIIRMRYMDALSWNEIVKIKYGKKQDFEERKDTYTRRVFSEHSRALSKMKKKRRRG